MYLEQVYKELSGEEKYVKASEWLATEAKAIGIDLTTDQIKGLVESAVKLMNDSIKKATYIVMSKQWPGENLALPGYPVCRADLQRLAWAG